MNAKDNFGESQSSSTSQDEILLKEVFGILWKLKFLILSGLIISGGIAYFFAKRHHNQQYYYSALVDAGVKLEQNHERMIVVSNVNNLFTQPEFLKLLFAALLSESPSFKSAAEKGNYTIEKLILDQTGHRTQIYEDNTRIKMLFIEGQVFRIDFNFPFSGFDIKPLEVTLKMVNDKMAEKQSELQATIAGLKSQIEQQQVESNKPASQEILEKIKQTQTEIFNNFQALAKMELDLIEKIKDPILKNSYKNSFIGSNPANTNLFSKILAILKKQEPGSTHYDGIYKEYRTLLDKSKELESFMDLYQSRILPLQRDVSGINEKILFSSAQTKYYPQFKLLETQIRFPPSRVLLITFFSALGGAIIFSMLCLKLKKII